jgi:starch synthase
MKIAMMASESNPLAKTGGLADVVFSLSKALVKKGHDVIVCLPYYESSKGRCEARKIDSFVVDMAWRQQPAEIYTTKIAGVTFYLIGNSYYFGRDKYYGYHDDGERFAFFALACRDLLKQVRFKADIVHCHDWEAGMVPVLIKEQNKNDRFYKDMKFVFTIHNPAFKGMLDKYFLQNFFGLPDSIYDNGKVRFNWMVSTLKSGIVYSDKVTTVSPTHREELLTPADSQGLDGVLNLRRDDFVGILNGIDTDEWDPKNDPDIAMLYDEKNLEKARHANQADLLKAFHIDWLGGPVYGLVSRLSWQKGIDLALESGKIALSKGANLVMLGSGEYELEQGLETLRREYPGTCGIYIGYNDKLAHKIYAGADYFLMPSLFEPCGTGQMIAQRYGAVPIVRYTGGLKDTVNGWGEGHDEKSNGIGFRDYDVNGLNYAMGLSLKLHENQKEYYNVARRAMKIDHSWDESASKYVGLYESILPRR